MSLIPTSSGTLASRRSFSHLRRLLTEARLLFRARVILILLVTELYIVVFMFMANDYDYDTYNTTVYHYANLMPWGFVGMVMAAEVVLNDAHSRVRGTLARMTDPFAVYAWRLCIIFAFCLAGALGSNLLLGWAVVPVPQLSMMLWFVSPLVLLISAGFLSGLRMKSESAALTLGTALILPLLGPVAAAWKDWMDMEPWERILREVPMLLVASALLYFARASLRQKERIGGES